VIKINIGLVYPQTEYGSDPAAIKDYAQTAEDLGFTHIVAYDHVLGANPERPEGWRRHYTYKTPFQEPFVLFSHMAAFTQKMRFVTGILVLPQRQTALVAKQAATLDILSGGRFRLGVAVGWNYVEFEALGMNFHNRGARIEEQVALLRRLWTEPLVNFEGQYHTIPDAGINPLPIQRPIPIWFGGQSEPVLRRTARMGDGWMINHHSPGSTRPDMEKLLQFMEEEGRDLENFGLEARLYAAEGSPDTWQKQVEDWEKLGITHLSINTMGAGLDTPQKHLDLVRQYADVLLE
jgi:probable F420-dependent oxidoreductase